MLLDQSVLIFTVVFLKVLSAGEEFASPRRQTPGSVSGEVQRWGSLNRYHFMGSCLRLNKENMVDWASLVIFLLPGYGCNVTSCTCDLTPAAMPSPQ